MKFKIWHKLAILLIATTSLTLVIGIGLSQQSFKNGFLNYRQNQEMRRLEILGKNLLMAYETEGSWEFIRNNNQLWFAYIRPRPGNGRFRTEDRKPGRENFSEDFFPGHRMQTHRPFHQMGRGRRLIQMTLLDSKQQFIVGSQFFKEETQLYPLKLKDKTIAFIKSEKISQMTDRLDQMFTAQQNRAFILNTLVSLVISLVVALLASIYFRKRISGLNRIAQQLTSGDYEQRIVIKQKDELGQLSMAFNTLAKTLQINQQSQRQWIADISHELRTPLAILKGELEALDDGIRPLDNKAIASLRQEIERLGTLIEDLYQLSISDMGSLKYKKSDFILHELLDELYDSFHARFDKQGLNLKLINTNPEQLLFHGDRQRIFQLLSKLLDNSLHYTAPDGEVWIKSILKEHQLIISIEDSEPGIEAQKLPHIFERLFRVENSRTRSNGGAGLGLAIAKEIVLAHQGEITAQASNLGGIKVTCTFPMKN